MKKYEYIISNIQPGSDNLREFRGRILYADVYDSSGKLMASATVGFILLVYYERKNKVANYKYALKKFIQFNDKLIRNLK